MYEVPVAVKDALREGTQLKNYRFLVLNDDGTTDFTINNNNLVSESVIIDERMCSGDTIKYGLCEGSSIEFQYFDKPNITGRRIRAFIDILFDGFTWIDYHVIAGTNYVEYDIPEDGTYKIIIPAYTPDLYVEGTIYATSNTDTEVSLGQLTQGVEINVEAVQEPNSFSVMLQKQTSWFPIPMGYFTIDKCSRQASTGILKATGYNKLMSSYLDQKANSLIVDAITNSDIYGRSGEAAIGTILDSLLNDYSVERGYVNATFSNVFQAHYEVAQYYYNGKGYGFIGTAEVVVDNFAQDKIYRVWINCKRIFERLWEYVPDELKAANSVGQLDYDSGTWVVRNYAAFKGIFNGTGPYPMESYINVQVQGASNWGMQINGANYTNPSALSDWMTNIVATALYGGSRILEIYNFPTYWKSLTYTPSSTDPDLDFTDEEKAIAVARMRDILEDPECFAFQEQAQNNAERIVFTLADAEALPDVTLRELQSASYETSCEFGQLSRTTDLFEGVELNRSRLYPADTLYPANNLYPDGAAASANKSTYSQLWADEGNIHKWRYLIITYKGTENGQEVEKVLQKTVNADGTDDYNMSDNWLFKNLTWTDSDVDDYAEAMKAKMQDITWFPFEMWCAGLPYLETGDEIEIPLGNYTYTSYVLQRQLKGIQNLQDTYINGTLDIF